MTDLAEFLLTRIAEDEAAAREIPAGSWEDACSTTRRYDHVFRWSPERVLAECAARRAIVAGYMKWDDATEAELGDNRFYGWLNGLEDACKCLALPYASHPDYDEAWRP